MNLSNYNIINQKIDFKDAKYANLQNLLNTNFNKIVTLNSYLQELLFIKNNWNKIVTEFRDHNTFYSHTGERQIIYNANERY